MKKRYYLLTIGVVCSLIGLATKPGIGSVALYLITAFCIIGFIGALVVDSKKDDE
jgi:hypothetical protein